MDSLQDIGKPAKDFSLNIPSGETITLSSLRGNVVVLDFWAVNCRSCLWMMKQLAPIREKHAAKGCHFFAINIDDKKEKLEDFLKENTISYTILYDDKNIDQAYGIRGIPHFVIIDKQGIIHARVIGGTSETVERIDSILKELTMDY
jgi:peroxiredoxin